VITNSLFSQYWHLRLASLLAIVGVIAYCADRACAQITTDNTLGTQSSVVTPNIDINGTLSDRIDGGAIRGGNLFHSFGEFNVGEGRGVYFTNPVGIKNILSRVSGNNVSNIFGKLGVLGNANLFLINPNGIIFGPNARLDVNGSFLISTASSLKFNDGTEFSAVAPQTTPLLTVSVPIGLQYGLNPGRILIQGNGQGLRETTKPVDTDFGLRVQPNQTLALVGGDVVLEGATLKTSGGRIELGSVAGEGLVTLSPTNKGFSLDYSGMKNFGNIQLSQQTIVDASGEGGGDVQVTGRRITFTNGSQIQANTLGSQPGGSLSVTASESVELTGSRTLANGRKQGSLLSARTYGVGSGGSLSITTGKLSLQDGAQVTASTHSEGQGGQVTVTASDSVQVIGESEDGEIASSLRATVESKATGSGGNVNVETKQLIVQGGAEVTSANFGAGKAGNVTIRAKEVRVIGTSAKYGGQYPSSINAYVNQKATGSGGNVNIDTEQLFVEDGGQIGTGTFGIGNAGNLNVHATDLVKVSGRSKDNISGSKLGTRVDQGAIGNAGNLTIDTKRLIVQDGGQIAADTSGKGSASNLSVAALESVELIGSGTNADGQVVSSGIFTLVNKGATGSGGNLTIKTGRLIIQDGAEVGAGSFGNGLGGTVEVTASESVELFGRPKNGSRSFIFSTTLGSEAAGKVRIATKRLVIRDGAEVTTSTYSSGSGGTVEVTASESVELSGTSTDGQYASKLTAETTGTGNAGNLTIKTGQLNVRDGAEVTVSSLGSGKAGNLEVQARSIKLDNQGAIISTTKSGNGGNIKLQAQDLLLLRRNSNISTTAGTAQAGGNGGNITINTPFIVAVPSENSDITANAFSGTGGRVDITTNGIFGILPQKIPTEISDITASSELGVSGEVTINSPDTDPSRGLVQLPSNLVDASQQIAQGCTPRRGQNASRFIATGRGGLPQSPNEPLRGRVVITGWVDLPEQVTHGVTDKSSTASMTKSSDPIVEAQGWIVDANGHVMLVAQSVQSSSIPSAISCSQ
jgi:filamentous hemagglutinin family protein